MLPVLQPSGEYQLEQKFREGNEAVVPVHPIEPNRCTLLVQIPAEASCFTALELKDVFFCIPIDLKCQLLFAFEWTEPDTLCYLRLRDTGTCTVLPEA
jgi:hypothetical protein